MKLLVTNKKPDRLDISIFKYGEQTHEWFIRKSVSRCFSSHIDTNFVDDKDCAIWYINYNYLSVDLSFFFEKHAIKKFFSQIGLKLRKIQASGRGVDFNTSSYYIELHNTEKLAFIQFSISDKSMIFRS